MLKVRGISYLVGEASADDVRRDLEIVERDLHCDTVMVTGGDVERLIEAARVALDVGLAVYLRPDHTDRPRRRINRRLHRLLARTVAIARRRFQGPLTYSAAGWEEVDWAPFDLVGVSLYRGARNQATYTDRLRGLVRDNAGKPVVITEFGCGAFTGADLRGAGSFQIVDWFAEPPRIRDDHPRDESVQARYLGELIDLYDAEGVHGCFVFTFAMPDFARREDPSLDLDKAGFGVMAVTEDGVYQRKEAFGEVARRYGG